jgi:ribulose 1,5-bisphosphate synthetase/thiazole synthase
MPTLFVRFGHCRVGISLRETCILVADSSIPKSKKEGDFVLHSEYDVIVVGAGPGGSIAAKVAAENGLSVLLLEKRQEIGAPVR